jgi:hypothetical protein
LLLAKRLFIVAIALLLALQIVRNAAVHAWAGLHPAIAAKVWAGHPAVEISLGLAEIGRAARERRPVDQPIFAMMADASTKSPLAPEPFLVRGVEAQTSGDREIARRAFEAAQRRDPRSIPAAYFLAEYYFRGGRPLEGLQQTALLARLSPGGNRAVAPFIALYARDRSTWPQVRALFRSQNGIEDAVLTQLALDPRNTDAILALADAQHKTPRAPWLSPLLSSLIVAGDYSRARAIWNEVARAGLQPRGLIYDPDFASPEPPPPFNWKLVSSVVGLAERRPGKRLHVVFYGNQDGVLASQLLLLDSGGYRLRMQAVGLSVHPEALRWSLRCDKASEPFTSIGIEEAVSRGWTFEIPANCPAQWLELSGRSGDIAQQSEATITALALEQAGAHG